MALRDQLEAIDLDIAARLKARRQHLSMSQEELGSALGVSHSAIDQYENARRRISPSALKKIASKLDISIAALFGEAEGAVRPRARGDGELALLGSFRQLSDRQKEAVVALVTSLADG